MLSKAQRVIIQHVCSIQFTNLIDILTAVDMGNNQHGEPYEETFKEMGFSRKEFDEELIQTIYNFEAVKDDPEKVFELEELDMVVFRHILHHHSHKWINEFPKATTNLWDKLFIRTVINLNKNL